MISVCIIVKNEEVKIEKCLKALKKSGVGDNDFGEIIVTDTGSTDNTKAVALKYTNKVFDYKWNDNFAMAKNFCIDKATYDYVLVLDSDEYITKISSRTVEDFIVNHPNDIGQIKRANYIDVNGNKGIQNDVTERLFNRKLYSFKGAIHEQVVPKTNICGTYVVTDICIDHDGYLLSEEKLREKTLRNNALLLKELEREPDNPYIYFQIGQSYLLSRDEEKALEYFEKGLAFDVDPKLEWVGMLITGYGQCLLSVGRNEDALNLSGIYDDMSFNPDYIFMMGQIYLANNLPIKAYQEFLKCLRITGARTEGATSYYSLHNIGVINEMLGEIESAKTFYEKAAALGYKRSADRLNELNTR